MQCFKKATISNILVVSSLAVFGSLIDIRSWPDNFFSTDRKMKMSENWDRGWKSGKRKVLKFFLKLPENVSATEKGYLGGAGRKVGVCHSGEDSDRCNVLTRSNQVMVDIIERDRLREIVPWVPASYNLSGQVFFFICWNNQAKYCLTNVIALEVYFNKNSEQMTIFYTKLLRFWVLSLPLKHLEILWSTQYSSLRDL